MTETPSAVDRVLPDSSRTTLIVLGGVGALLLYSYWNTLAELWKGIFGQWDGYWWKAEYSLGWVVPLFAAALLYLRWDPKVVQPFFAISTRTRWYGAGLLAFGLVLRLVFA